MSEAVVHIFHDDSDSLEAGAQAADRIRRLRPEHNMDMGLEIYVSGPARKSLIKGKAGKYNGRIDALACDGRPVKTPLALRKNLACRLSSSCAA